MSDKEDISDYLIAAGLIDNMSPLSLRIFGAIANFIVYGAIWFFIP